MEKINTRPLRKDVSSTRSLSHQPFVSRYGDTRSNMKQTKALVLPTNLWLFLTALGFGAFMIILDTSLTSIWALAALFPLLGIGLVLALLVVSRRYAPCAKIEMASWNSCYFFSLSGSITAQTIQRYLAVQHLSLTPSSLRPVKQSSVQAHRFYDALFALPSA